MQAATRESMASSVRNDWGTPRVVLDPIDQMGGIELDPCANLRSVVECRQRICLPEDGLAVSWYDRVLSHSYQPVDALDLLEVKEHVPVKVIGDGGIVIGIPPRAKIVFVNPPYGRAIKKWVEKCREEAAKGCEIVLLVAGRVDTKWFQENIFATAQAVCFWKGRIKFIDLSTGLQGDPAFFPSVVAYWGQARGAFNDAFGDKGRVIHLRE